MRKKVRVSLPKLIHEVIYIDIQYFKLRKETLYNLIIQGLGFEKLLEIGGDLLDERKTISFNLNDINTELFQEMMKFQKMEKESIFINKVFMTYANLHPSIRERTINRDLFMRIEQAVKENKSIKIYYRKKLLDGIPIELERDRESGYNYLKVKIENQQYLYEMKDIEFVT